MDSDSPHKTDCSRYDYCFMRDRMITLFCLPRLVIYPFTARAPYELSLTLGAQMEIVEQNSGILKFRVFVYKMLIIVCVYNSVGWFRGYEITKPTEKV